MEKREAVVAVLKESGCLTSAFISLLAKRRHGVDVSPASVAHIVNAMEKKGYAASSKNERNQNVYWLIAEPEWEVAKKKGDADLDKL